MILMPLSDLCILGAAVCGAVLFFAVPWTLVDPRLGLVDLAALAGFGWCLDRGERA